MIQIDSFNHVGELMYKLQELRNETSLCSFSIYFNKREQLWTVHFPEWSYSIGKYTDPILSKALQKAIDKIEELRQPVEPTTIKYAIK